MQTIDEALDKLEKSKYRSGFYLTKKEQQYLDEKGIAVIRSHAQDFVRQKLAPAEPLNDGKQTPMHGHPVFKAMHATACCCRGCLNKWYKVPLHKELSEKEQEKIVNLLMAWIERQRNCKTASDNEV
jgi:exodeoxyribonuclease V alpha subunit